MKLYYILEIETYESEFSNIVCSADRNDYMFAVLLITDDHADIVDMGYSSVDELLKAWNTIAFQNIKDYL